MCDQAIVDELLKCENSDAKREFLSDPHNLEGCREFILLRGSRYKGHLDKYFVFAPKDFILDSVISEEENIMPLVIQSVIGSYSMTPKEQANFYDLFIKEYEKQENKNLIAKLDHGKLIDLLRDLYNHAIYASFPGGTTNRNQT